MASTKQGGLEAKSKYGIFIQIWYAVFPQLIQVQGNAKDAGLKQDAEIGRCRVSNKIACMWRPF